MSVYIVMTKGFATDTRDAMVLGCYRNREEAKKWFPKIWKRYKDGKEGVGVFVDSVDGITFDDGTYIRLEDEQMFWKYL